MDSLADYIRNYEEQQRNALHRSQYDAISKEYAEIITIFEAARNAVPATTRRKTTRSPSPKPSHEQQHSQASIPAAPPLEPAQELQQPSVQQQQQSLHILQHQLTHPHERTQSRGHCHHFRKKSAVARSRSVSTGKQRPDRREYRPNKDDPLDVEIARYFNDPSNTLAAGVEISRDPTINSAYVIGKRRGVNCKLVNNRILVRCCGTGYWITIDEFLKNKEHETTRSMSRPKSRAQESNQLTANNLLTQRERSAAKQPSTGSKAVHTNASEQSQEEKEKPKDDRVDTNVTHPQQAQHQQHDEERDDINAKHGKQLQKPIPPETEHKETLLNGDRGHKASEPGVEDQPSKHIPVTESSDLLEALSLSKRVRQPPRIPTILLVDEASSDPIPQSGQQLIGSAPTPPPAAAAETTTTHAAASLHLNHPLSQQTALDDVTLRGVLSLIIEHLQFAQQPQQQQQQPQQQIAPNQSDNPISSLASTDTVSPDSFIPSAVSTPLATLESPLLTDLPRQAATTLATPHSAVSNVQPGEDIDPHLTAEPEASNDNQEENIRVEPQQHAELDTQYGQIQLRPCSTCEPLGASTPSVATTTVVPENIKDTTPMLQADVSNESVVSAKSSSESIHSRASVVTNTVTHIEELQTVDSGHCRRMESPTPYAALRPIDNLPAQQHENHTSWREGRDIFHCDIPDNVAISPHEDDPNIQQSSRSKSSGTRNRSPNTTIGSLCDHRESATKQPQQHQQQQSGAHPYLSGHSIEHVHGLPHDASVVSSSYQSSRAFSRSSSMIRASQQEPSNHNDDTNNDDNNTVHWYRWQSMESLFTQSMRSRLSSSSPPPLPPAMANEHETYEAAGATNDDLPMITSAFDDLSMISTNEPTTNNLSLASSLSASSSRLSVLFNNTMAKQKHSSNYTMTKHEQRSLRSSNRTVRSNNTSIANSDSDALTSSGSDTASADESDYTTISKAGSSSSESSGGSDADTDVSASSLFSETTTTTTISTRAARRRRRRGNRSRCSSMMSSSISSDDFSFVSVRTTETEAQLFDTKPRNRRVALWALHNEILRGCDHEAVRRAVPIYASSIRHPSDNLNSTTTTPTTTTTTSKQPLPANRTMTHPPPPPPDLLLDDDINGNPLETTTNTSTLASSMEFSRGHHHNHDNHRRHLSTNINASSTLLHEDSKGFNFSSGTIATPPAVAAAEPVPQRSTFYSSFSPPSMHHLDQPVEAAAAAAAVVAQQRTIRPRCPASPKRLKDCCHTNNNNNTAQPASANGYVYYYQSNSNNNNNSSRGSMTTTTTTTKPLPSSRDLG